LIKPRLDVVFRQPALRFQKPRYRQLVKIIVALGQLVKRKDFGTLIRAFALTRKTVDAKLIIFGEGPERKHLSDLVTELGLDEQVSLPGYLEGSPWSNTGRADLFVMSSVDEAFCLVLAEAMACGIPVVATDAIGGGPRSILGDSKYGVLVPRGDAQGLADAIVKVISSRDLRDQLVVAGKKRCEVFRPESVARKWISFIGDVVGHSPERGNP
jgi:glycosyltransferase involved in cell wall biosynthesis